MIGLALELLPLLSGRAIISSTQRILLSTGPPVALLRSASGTEFVLGACDRSISSTCERAKRTDNPADEEAWHFNVQIKMTGPYGAKVGTAPMTVHVLGPIYETWPHKNSPCEGPMYFTRGSAGTAGTQVCPQPRSCCCSTC